MATEKTKGGCYCHPSKRGKALLGRTSPRYCPVCKLRIRSTKKAHEEGMHHKGTVPKNSRY